MAGRVRRFRDKIVVVTGAASGIGRALALSFAREGAVLALADRDRARLEETASAAAHFGGRVTSHDVDIGHEDAVRAFALEVEQRHGGADVLMNNAGVSLYGSVMEMSTDEFQWVMDVNFWGVVYGVRAFLPMLLARPEAAIVNVSSLFGLFAPPGQAAYAASKYAVRGFSESLRGELAGTPVHVMTVYPAGIATSIARSARVAGAADPIAAARSSAKFDSRFLRIPADAAANAILNGIRRNNDTVLIGRDARRVHLMTRIFGFRAAHILARRVRFDHARNRRAAP